MSITITPIYQVTYISINEATQEVEVTVTTGAPGLPTGGATGQVLAKKTATNYDVEWVNQTGGGGGGVTDHGALTGLADDDHPQYHNDARGDARYSQLGHTHDDRYYTESEVDTALAAKSNTGHTHDDRYYTESEVDSALAAKSNTGHTHTASNVTDFAAAVSANTDVAANTAARHSHSNISILHAITEAFTTALKTAYDTAASWISTNGSALLAHLTNTANPHSVTKAQVGLSNADNTSDADKPISTATATALAAKSNTGHTHSGADLTIDENTNSPITGILKGAAGKVAQAVPGTDYMPAGTTTKTVLSSAVTLTNNGTYYQVFSDTISEGTYNISAALQCSRLSASGTPLFSARIKIDGVVVASTSMCPGSVNLRWLCLQLNVVGHPVTTTSTLKVEAMDSQHAGSIVSVENANADTAATVLYVTKVL